jgi:hypothetical protein
MTEENHWNLRQDSLFPGVELNPRPLELICEAGWHVQSSSEDGNVKTVAREPFWESEMFA